MTWSHIMLRTALSFLLILVVYSCHKDSQETPPANSDNFVLTEKQRSWWIEKAVRKLRLGKGIRNAEELQSLKNKSDREIVFEIMNNDDFLEVLLDLNIYFLGFKGDKTKYPHPSDPLSFFSFFDPNILSHAVAIEGVNLYKKNKDVFHMFRGGDVPMIQLPMMLIFTETGFIPPEETISKRRNLLAEKVSKLLSLIHKLDAIESKVFCTESLEFSPSELFNVGIAPEYFIKLYNNEGFNRTDKFCRALPESQNKDLLNAEIKTHIRAFGQAYIELIDSLKDWDWDRYLPKKFGDILFRENRLFPNNDFEEYASWNWMWAKLVNSSTNSNRKRAAYILKRFFCDDLTPVNIVASNSHNPENRHASDPSCQSCHYKLDPMAGFFRYIDGFGNQLTSFETPQTFISFSDGARRELKSYVAGWKGAAGSNHTWDVAYIRSSIDDSLNDYSDHPENPQFGDLLAIIRKSPEVKQCFVRRTFEYFVGDKQVFDEAYLESITKDFIQQSETAPSDALKELIFKAVNSKTFKQANANPDECYDLPKGIDLSKRAPCKIAAVLERNCLSCHRGTSAAGGLDLSEWTSDKNVYQNIVDRLESTDPSLRMPLNKHMSDRDRDILFLYFKEKLAQKGN